MIDEFVIVRDGAEVATVSRDGTATAGVYTDSGLIPGRQYGYQVRCRDSSTGSTSAPSPVVNVTTDTIPTPTVYQFRYPFGERNGIWCNRMYQPNATFAANEEFSPWPTEEGILKTPSAADFLLDWAGARNISDLYVTVQWHDGVMWDSPTYPVFPPLDGTFGDYDGLQYLLDGAQSRGMKIWCTFQTMRYSLEPDWISPETASEPDYNRALDPANADARAFVIGRSVELFNLYGDHSAFAGQIYDYFRSRWNPINDDPVEIAANHTNMTAIIDGIRPTAIAKEKEMGVWSSFIPEFYNQGNLAAQWLNDGKIDRVFVGMYSIPGTAPWQTKRIATAWGKYEGPNGEQHEVNDMSKVEFMASPDDRSTPGLPILSNAEIDRYLAWRHIASSPLASVGMYTNQQWPAALLDYQYGPDGIYAETPTKTVERIWARDGLDDLCHIRYSNNSEVPAAVVNGGIEITANTMAGLCAQPSGTTWRMAILFRPDWSSTETLSADPVIMSRHVAPVDETVSLTWGRLGYRWVITGYENGNPFGHSAVLSHDAGDVLGILVNVGPSGSNITVRNYTKGTESFGNRPGAITFRKKAMCRVGALEGFSSNTVPFTWLGVQQGPAAALWEPPLSSSTAGVLTE